MEAYMKRKEIWLGMLAAALVFGMTVVGCAEEEDKEYPAELKVTNSTSVEITLVELRTSGNTVVKSDRTGIPAGQSKIYELDSDFSGSAKVELSPLGIPLVECTIDNLNLYIGYDKGSQHLSPAKKELLLSGSILSGFELTIKDQ
jgi:uncharacterized protein (DUF2147 family)